MASAIISANNRVRLPVGSEVPIFSLHYSEWMGPWAPTGEGWGRAVAELWTQAVGRHATGLAVQGV